LGPLGGLSTGPLNCCLPRIERERERERAVSSVLMVWYSRVYIPLNKL